MTCRKKRYPPKPATRKQAIRICLSLERIEAALEEIERKLNVLRLT